MSMPTEPIVPRLPPELWRLILRQATYVPDLLCTNWNYDPEDRIWESWFGEKLDGDRSLDERLNITWTIVQVCQGWREIGTEFLYEVIPIPSNQDSPRLRSLVKTLTASNSAATSQLTTGSVSYGWWTKRITFRGSFISDDLFEHFFALLEQCRNLEILSLYTFQDIPEKTQLRLLQLLESRFSHSLRRLDNYMYAKSHESHVKVAPRMPGLASLGVIMRSLTPSPFVGGTSFKNITALTIWSFSLSQSFPSEWIFPSLTTLSLRSFSGATHAVAPFVKMHQHTLLHLHLETTWSRNHQVLQIPAVLSNAPHLRSLSLEKGDLDSLGVWPTNNILLPKLAYLGVAYDPGKRGAGPWTRHSLKYVLDGGLFPELRVIRLLSTKNKIAPGFKWSEVIERCEATGVRFEGRRGQAINGESGNIWANS